MHVCVAETAIGPDVIVSSRLYLIGPYHTDLHSIARASSSFTVDNPLNGLSHVLTPPSFLHPLITLVSHTVLDCSVYFYTR